MARAPDQVRQIDPRDVDDDMTQHPRRLLWDGCLNVRDLGGYAAANGRVTRTYSLVRSDNLARLTATGQQVVHETGVSLIVDLRSPYELDLEVNPFALSADTRPFYLNLPLIDEADTEGMVYQTEAVMSYCEDAQLRCDDLRESRGVGETSASTSQQRSRDTAEYVQEAKKWRSEELEPGGAATRLQLATVSKVV